MPAAVPAITKEEELHWLALRLVPGLGTSKAGRLIEQFRAPQAIFQASRSDLEASGLSGSVAQTIASGCTFEDAVDQQQKMLETGTALVPIADPRYPARLKEIFDPPVVLFARGRLELLQSIMLGIVGTRRPTAYGIAAAERLSPDLAQAGLTIVSGMARGIDTAAHRSALSVGGDTMAVFGCGVDLVYPAENRKLAGEIAEKGLLLSEFPMGSPAYPQNFPIRNRVISGMSVGILVVEGAQYSGSSITARMALEQQREVFAVPGNITSKMSWGPNLLIKQGAKLVQEWNDVSVELPADIRRALIAKAQARYGQISLETKDEEAAPAPEISAASRALMKALKADLPTHIDELMETFDTLTSSEIIAGLFELEMLGLVRQLPGKNFVKVW
ncbi:MAG TPA: DNA-processing protein DprA [Bryobacteraceae bacterium]|nr:DNA-processing protein DprA [Bryobacteraceae bacterium]